MAGPLAEITTILREVLLDPSLECAPATRFEDVTGWDSMDLVTVVVEVECRFGLQFELAEIDRLVTVGDLLRMVAAKRALLAA
ncbi:MAG TPA: acyl carrier protein [Rhodopila sp.]|nr:acyl carrier protein [Rhodopila sp.]